MYTCAMDKRKNTTKAGAGTKTAEVMATVVDGLIAEIEAGAGTWSMPWSKLGKSGLPNNPVSKIVYQGGNIISLWLAAEAKGYPTAQWATYNQWESVKAQVRKNEKGTYAFKWVTKPAEKDEAGNIVKKATGFYSVFSLFNIAQVDNAPATLTPEPLSPVERIEVADRWFGALPAEVRYGGDRAFYSTNGDYIQVPEWDQFKSPLHGYATLAHELGHWTGHKDRLNREFGKRFGDDAYAAEELVAELSAAFTCATIGIDTVERLDHAAYLTNWCSMLKADPGKLWTVASKASAATEFLAAFVAEAVAA